MRELKGVGLSFSGGGYRASLFHLGVARRLHELGILQTVTRLSTVSGGSIFAAFMADRMLAAGKTQLAFDDWDAEISTPFRKALRKDIRTGLFVRHIAWNWLMPGLRARDYEHALKKHISKRLLSELPTREQGVEFMFLATDMKAGVLWKFSRETVGEYTSGSWPTPADLPIAKAVAASACFPPVFGPIKIKRSGHETAYLTDGGVYDNTGMEPIWDNNKVVLVSDAGAPFVDKPGRWYGSRLLRYSEIGRNQVGAQRRRALIDRLATDYHTVRTLPAGHATLASRPNPCANAGASACYMDNRRPTDKPVGSYWRLQSKKANFLKDASASFKAEVAELEKGWYGYSAEKESDIVPKYIAAMRTDLDSFTTDESGILENHGYYMADIAVRRHANGLGNFSAPFSVPNPTLIDPAIVQRALRNSHKRLASWRRWFNRG